MRILYRLLSIGRTRMSSLSRPKRRLTGIAIVVSLAFAALPVAAQAAAVNLGTASPFVVLGGAAVTNTGPSVLKGDLGVSPGTSLTGFGSATILGATHENDGVASQAQADSTTAYNVAAGQPVPPQNDLTGTNLGNRILTPGAYGYSSSAGLTGTLTLDAQGDPNAQFVFVIGTTLITESASSVVLINGASPCNVYWKVGSSATLGTTTAFAGNVLALADISLNNGATVQGRVLAHGEITLNNNVLEAPQCATPEETAPQSGGTPTSPTVPSPVGPTVPTPVSSPSGKGTAHKAKGKEKAQHTAPASNGTAGLSHTPQPAGGYKVGVKGKKIRSVTVTDNGKVVSKGNGLQTVVSGTPGTHRIVAHVTFTDHTPSKTLRFHYRVATPAPLHPHHGPSAFTG